MAKPDSVFEDVPHLGCRGSLRPKRVICWPRLKYETRRAINAVEAQRLLDIEPNPEWKAFLQLLWHIGAAQVDMAALTHENINWQNRTISYTRKKTGTLALQKFGAAVEAILRDRPAVGMLFPHFGKQDSAARATRFSDRCRKLGITGVSLHSYRYAWAERAREVGYPERFAREALGHTSAAVHRAYAKGAKVNIPSLDEFEQRSPRASIGRGLNFMGLIVVNSAFVPLL